MKIEAKDKQTGCRLTESDSEISLNPNLFRATAKKQSKTKQKGSSYSYLNCFISSSFFFIHSLQEFKQNKEKAIV